MRLLERIARTVTGPGFFRMILAGLVVLTHTTPLVLGATAVYLFFVLSGYWIAEMWQNQYRHCRAPYLTFIVSRYWRLAPLYLLCLGLATGANRLCSIKWPGIARHFSDPWAILAIPALLGNPIQNALLQQAWSLAVEWKFYLIAPILLIAWGSVAPGRQRKPGAVALLACGAVLFASLDQDADLRYFGFFSVGILAQSFKWNPSLKLVWSSSLLCMGMLGLCLASAQWHSLIWISDKVALSPRDILAASFMAGVICVLMAPYAIFTVHRPSSPADRILGNLSYTVYLFHTMVITAVWAVLWKLPRLPANLLIWLVTGIGSIGIYFAFELPLERRRKYFVKSRMGSREQVEPLAPDSAGVPPNLLRRK